MQPVGAIRAIAATATARARDLLGRLTAFMDEHVYPNEATYHRQLQAERWQPAPLIEELKAKAQAAGLWNLFLPDSEHGAGLTNLEYAPLCEVMGRVPWAISHTVFSPIWAAPATAWKVAVWSSQWTWPRTCAGSAHGCQVPWAICRARFCL